jgi:hypothetical protein
MSSCKENDLLELIETRNMCWFLPALQLSGGLTTKINFNCLGRVGDEQAVLLKDIVKSENPA